MSMKLLSFGPMIFLSTMPGPIPFSHGSAGRLRTIAPMILSEEGAHSRVISILRGYVLRPDVDRVVRGAWEPRFRRVEVRPTEPTPRLRPSSFNQIVKYSVGYHLTRWLTEPKHRSTWTRSSRPWPIPFGGPLLSDWPAGARPLVWTAWTDPKLIPRWWGPKRYTTTVEKMEVRPGGTWRFIQRDSEGKVYGFHGEYKEVVPPERIVDTFEYEGMPGHVLIESATFEEIDGRTKVTQKSVFETVEDLEGMLASGMEDGARETMERFTELVHEMKEGASRLN